MLHAITFLAGNVFGSGKHFIIYISICLLYYVGYIECCKFQLYIHFHFILMKVYE